MFTLAFWKAAAERAAKTAAQAAIVQLVVGDGFNAFDADWGTAGGFAAGGAVMSLLFSLASSGFGSSGPSLGAETLTPLVAAVEAPVEEPAVFVAGPAADVPEGEPVDVTEAPKDDDPKTQGGYWGGV